MLNTLAILGGLSACLLLVAAVSPYVARLISAFFAAWASTVESSRMAFREESRYYHKRIVEGGRDA